MSDPGVSKRASAVLGLKLSAADPDQAWSLSDQGDYSALSQIITGGGLMVETAEGKEVALSELVGNGKALVVFMRHVG